jgi:hypothetical protein
VPHSERPISEQTHRKLVKRPNEPGGHDLAVVAEIKVGLDVPGICRVMKAPPLTYSKLPTPRFDATRRQSRLLYFLVHM